MHDKYSLDEHRAESRLHVSQVVRAEEDRLDRCLYIYNADDTVRPLPTLELPRGGRIGRVRSDQRGGFLVAELFFDQVLARGDTAVLEYAVTFPPGGEPAMCYERSFHLPARQYVLEVQFHAAAVPARCHQTFRPQATATHEIVRELWIGGSHIAHAVMLDPTPGLHGIGWEWQ